MKESFCQQDGFPLVNLRGRRECAAEYLHRCLEQRSIVDVVEEAHTIYFAPEDGHALPLLCFCCDTPLAVPDLEKERRDMRGRQLESMACPHGTLDNGQEAIQFRLNFTKKGLFGKSVSIPISLQSVVRLRHPVTCSQHTDTPAPSNRPRKRRK